MIALLVGVWLHAAVPACPVRTALAVCGIEPEAPQPRRKGRPR